MSDVWHVRLASGQQTMTLDELDAAYQSGAIDERTQVREDGSTEWTTLGALLGIEAEPPAKGQQESVRPLALDVDEELAQLKSNGRRNALIGLAAAALALGGFALAITRIAPQTEKAAAAGKAAMVVAPTAAEQTESETTGPRLSEQQKQALTKQDEERQKKLREARERRAREAPVPQQKSAPVFTKNGNKYDPLNAGF
jgi:hypothetical protein